MLNSVILIGRIVETPELGRFKDTDYTNIVLAVHKPFKNINGEDDADFIRVSIWNAFARPTCEYCRKGDVIAVRGRISSKTSDVKFDYNGEILKKRVTTCDVIAERVVFIQVNGAPEKMKQEDEEVEKGFETFMKEQQSKET